MIKKYFLLRAEADVNQSGATSDSSSEATESSNQNDVNTEGGDSSSSSQQKQEQAKTLEDVIQDVVKDSQSSSEEADAESGVQKSNGTEEEKKEEGQAQEEGKTQTEQSEEEKVEEGKPVPYERFSEVYTKAKTYEEQVKGMEPFVQAQRGIIEHCQNHQVTPEQFQQWMEIAALANTNPAEAVKRLTPLFEQMQSFTGDKLPAELQAAVDNGDISLEMAKRLVKAENASQFTQKRVQMTEQNMLKKQEQEFVGQLSSAVQNWVTAKKASDPDFVPKKSENAPHGKFEFFFSEFNSQVQANLKNIRDAKDLTALAEKAYSIVNSSLKGMQPKLKGSKTLSATNSTSSKQESRPKTLDAAMADAAKKHGISLPVSK